jgi:hypothetical protein
MVELCAVLVDQACTIPSGETLDEWATGVQKFT